MAEDTQQPKQTPAPEPDTELDSLVSEIGILKEDIRKVERRLSLLEAGRLLQGRGKVREEHNGEHRSLV